MQRYQWWLATASPEAWGVTLESAEWVRLDDLDQHCWQVSRPLLATPWWVCLRLERRHADGRRQQRWWFCWQHWLPPADYRRLLRAIQGWRQDGR